MNPFMGRNLSLRIQASTKRYNKAIHQGRRRMVAAQAAHARFLYPMRVAEVLRLLQQDGWYQVA
jgi:hypothetical protein